MECLRQSGISSELKVDCTKKRCRISNGDGFEMTILDDLTPLISEGKCNIDMQYYEAIDDKPQGVRMTIFLS